MPQSQPDAVDHVLPNGKWSFDGDVTDVFDNMLERSIPYYEIMRQACFEVACRYRQPKTEIVDLGCSRGEAMSKLIDRYGATNHFVGVEVSEPMLAAAKERFKGLMESGVVSIQNVDLRREYPAVRASVTLCVLTLQFTPIEYRQQIVQNIYDQTVSGGALILVEKVTGNTAPIDNWMVDIYYGLKRENGYTEEEIQRKRLSLEGVLVPLTAEWNVDLLRRTGFSEVDCFWRWMNFAAWVAVKK
ncbi:MAG: Carboxy-S-adenosyl-L-methionine synthase [Anaerolineae bacterium]|nr:Carboxy-S-adenosyl-L-methionine synthase [Anaerolineae bacterium]